MLSGLVGNTFTYFQFKDSYEIHPEDQVGVILFLLPIKSYTSSSVCFFFQDVFLTVLVIIVCGGICVNFLYLPMPWAAASE